MTEHDAKGLEIIASWLDKDGLVEPAAMLRRLAAGESEGQASDVKKAARYDWLRSKHELGGQNLDEQIDAAIEQERRNG